MEIGVCVHECVCVGGGGLAMQLLGLCVIRVNVVSQCVFVCVSGGGGVLFNIASLPPAPLH